MKDNPLVKLFGALWHYSLGNKKVVALFWFGFVLNEAINVVAQPLLWAEILNSVQKHKGVNEHNLHILFWYLGLMLGLTILFWSIHGPARVTERTNAFKARISYRKFLLSGVMSLPLDWHTEHHSGDTIDKIEKGTNALYDFGQGTFVMMYSLTRLVVCLLVLAYYSQLAILVAIVMMCISAWITMRFDKVLIPQYRELSRMENRVSESVFDAISNIGTVIILRVERLVFNAIVVTLEKPLALFVKNAKLSELKWFLTALCCRVMICLTLGVYFWQQNRAQGAFEIGSYYLLINYLEKVSDLFARFCDLYGDVVIRRARVMNAEELSSDFKPSNLTNHVLPKDWQKLDIENLSFSYPGKEGDIHLDDVSLSFTRGGRTAFVGASGSGKTTMLMLIRGIYKPSNIKLSVDGVVVDEGFDGIEQAITLVPQNPDIFATTILRNITLGAEYSMSVVSQFIDMACFGGVVENLPNGLDSSTKEKGVNLSGGERQRLALARGLLACRGKDIVLLDEPTSSLDAGIEKSVYQNMLEGFEGKTIVSSIHRLHLLPLFDRIIMFDKGKVVGDGSLKELLETCPEFQRLWVSTQNSNK